MTVKGETSRLGDAMGSALIFAMLFLVMVSPQASAHKAHSGQDYSRFQRKNGGSCCNNQDCRPVEYRYRSDGKVEMYPDGRVVVVPSESINEQHSDDGQAHWCGILMPNNATTFCAILPLQLSESP
ncbi:MAG: hypothetical protein AB7O43_10820 [Hyphomicrobiaceae bacterium]